MENYYSAYSGKELNDFFNVVHDGKDPMLAQRQEISKKYVKNFDGRNGERIKEFIIKVFEEENGKIK